ncbi:MAG: hypothetical protein HOP15_03505 [Planctomycetes bacterium]|nr:hypothetical protein [Planctomycetota bacterium]
MPLHRVLLVPSVLIALAPLAEERIAFGVAAETTLVRTLENEYTMELDSLSLTMNGEDVPADMFGEFEMHIERRENFVVTDMFEAVGEGRPERLRRSFDELGGKEQTRYSSEEGEQSDDTDYASALEGKSVVFTWNAESEEFEAAFAEGAAGEAELLERLEEDMDLRRFLPAGAVSADESWQVEAGAIVSVLDPGGDMLLADTDGEELDTDEQEALLRANYTGTIEAVYQGTREVDGVNVAVIALEADVRTHADTELGPDEVPEGARGTSRIEAAYQLAGELLWDLEHGHALSLELSGEHEFTLRESSEGDFEGESMEQSQTMVFSGSTRLSMRFERE